MKFKKCVIWWLVNDKNHPLVERKEMEICSLMPIIEVLFPGIKYYSRMGFGEVMIKCVLPALRKQFPELLGTPNDKIAVDETVEVAEFLPSDGYEWQRNPQWKAKFQALLSA